MFYRAIVQPLLFLLPAETAHRLVMREMAWFSRIPFGRAFLRMIFGKPDPALQVQLFGRTLQSPIGLAAGLDKDAEAYEAFGALGFGCVEVGTLTAEAQPGNPRPRLFRLKRDRALINRMGFNNRGAEAAAKALAAARHRGTLLGINIGKTKNVPPESAVDDYVRSATLLGPFADYLVINVSSPNTPGLRDLQTVALLRPIMVAVRQALEACSPARRVPLLVKIAPDLCDSDIDAVADLALELGLDGIVAVNTTVSRAGLRSDPREVSGAGAGGLSGPVLAARALEVLSRLRGRVGERLVLVSVGGVATVDDVWARLEAGASLVQLYTALIYEGPGLLGRLHRGLLERFRTRVGTSPTPLGTRLP